MLAGTDPDAPDHDAMVLLDLLGTQTAPGSTGHAEASAHDRRPGPDDR
ncbi:hypothetical protein ACWGKQ_25440 [Streptomyces sp. NPDC054770]